MERGPRISLSIKAGLILFAVVAGALGIVYFAVVPQLEERLVADQDRRAGAKRPARSEPVRAGEPARLRQPVGPASRRNLGRARDHLRRGRGNTFRTVGRLARDQLERRRRTIPSRSLRSRPPDLANGRVDPGRPERAEVAVSRRTRNVVLLSDSLRRRARERPSRRRSLLAAGVASLAISWLAGYLIAWSCHAPDPPARGGRRIASPRATSRRRSSTRIEDEVGSSRTPSTACGSARGLSTGPAGSSSPTPRTSCGRRSSRSEAFSSSWPTRTRPGDAPRLPRGDAGADRPSDAPRDRSARPLAPRRRAARCRAAAGRPRRRAPASSARSFGRSRKPASALSRRRERPRAGPCRRAARAPDRRGSSSRTRLRHTPEGTTSSCRQATRTARVALSVTDDGPGCPGGRARAPVRALLPGPRGQGLR